MKIKGSQFLDALHWLSQPAAPVRYRWDDTAARSAGLVTEDGKWNLDKDHTYDLASLGRIEVDGRFLVADTEGTIRTILMALSEGEITATEASPRLVENTLEPETNDEAVRLVVAVPASKRELAIRAMRREHGRIVPVHSNGSRTAGVDVLDFIAHGIPDGHEWKSSGKSVDDPTAIYLLKELGTLAPISNRVRPTVTSSAMRDFLRSRQVVPLVVEAKAEHLGAVERAASIFSTDVKRN